MLLLRGLGMPEQVQSRTEQQPILAHTSYAAGPQNSDWFQVFNPTWVQASPATGNRTGLLVRSQNCQSFFCRGVQASHARVLAFSPLPACRLIVLRSRHPSQRREGWLMRPHLRRHWPARLLAHLGRAHRRRWR